LCSPRWPESNVLGAADAEVRDVRAVVVHGAGDVRVEQHAPPEPTAGHVLIRVAFGGVCGSDVSYWKRGRVADFVLREPLVLGHEISGTVVDASEAHRDLREGQTVTVHPASPCGRCGPCRVGHPNVCERARYLGSAAWFPHVQGAFADVLQVRDDQVVPLPECLSLRDAALAEPLGVALHALNRAGDVAGRRVLVSGCGPIGALTVAAALARGAAEVVTTDVAATALQVGSKLGARTVNVTEVPAGAHAEAIGPVDAAVETSGSGPGLTTALAALTRRGVLVPLGLAPGEIGVPMATIVSREITLRGSFRFDTEIVEAVRLLAAGLPAEHVISHVIDVEQAAGALALAADPTRSCKVLLDLGNSVAGS
jgi:L-idonate 5-dehydrogenase